jgi:putative PIG3 family NAD(P)H quinone oxidoreductase
MRAIIIAQPGGPEVLQAGDVVTPTPGLHEMRVRVHAAGVNRADLLQRRGHYPAPAGLPANVPGLEYAGVVDMVGVDSTRWQLGDRVMGLVGGGAYAEAVVVHEAEALRMPATLSFIEAAAVPEAFLTAYDALRTRLAVRRGETVLIHAVASGVGTAAAQLAKQLGCIVFGTARSQWKLERVQSLGVDVAIDTTREDFVEVVRTRTDGRGVDAIVDLVGGDYLGRNLAALAVLGRIAVVGLVAGSAAPLDMRMLLSKRATMVGTVMRARTLDEKIAVVKLFEREVMPWLESGAVAPVVDRVFGLAEAAEAHRVMEANRNFGKLVIRMG